MKNSNISQERMHYLKQIRINKAAVLFTQLFVLIGFIAVWEILANLNIIDSFITSQPSRILKTLTNLTSNDLLTHIGVTVYETLVGFVIGSILGSIIAIILWWSKFLEKVSEPYLVVLNSLPKVALRANNNFMGWCRYKSHYSCSFSNFYCCYNIRNFKWI